MIQTSDLRKGNFVQTEHGILPVQSIVFTDIYVLGKDGRVLYAKEVEGVEIDTIDTEKVFNILDISTKENFRKLFNVDWEIKFIHEIQNAYYWLTRKELLIFPQSLNSLL